MKGKLIAFASILCIASLMVSGANADKPNTPPGKGDKPPKTNTELIVFQGALQGWAHVEGCCPNAGPSPRYTMYLPDGLRDFDNEQIYPIGTYDGELFMNGYGAGQDRDQYIVQFHACCTHVDSVDICKDSLPELKFQIIGGTSVYDKKNKVLAVTVVDAPYWADTWDWNRDEYAGEVSFEITRAQSSCTDDICTCEYADVAPHLCPQP
jgi:hypothetical protein